VLSFQDYGSYLKPMRWLVICIPLFCCLALPPAVHSSQGHIVKVLPQLLDLKGRHSLTPSLYDRDAYQFYLRHHPNDVSGLRFNVQWKASIPKTEELKLRVEIRGVVQDKLPKEAVLEKVLSERHFFSHWNPVDMTGPAYKEFGEVTAWRATLWNGDQMLSEQKSFLW
jgi:hypothetical protein